jgi:peptidoglycan/LPS O-acetylase OafA/YrhL
MSQTDRTRERRFLLAFLGGVFVTAVGFVALVLALSVSVRDPVTEVPLFVRSVGFYGGLAGLAAGVVFRDRPWGRPLAGAGLALFVVAGSTAVATRTGAPYVSQVDRWAIGALSLVCLVGGVRAIRLAASEVGWA